MPFSYIGDPKDGESTSTANVLSPEGSAIGTYRGDDYYTYLNDIQGSTTNLVKSDGNLVAAYDYTDFGETTEITGSDFDNQICYTGGIYDKETELYYLNARYYDPATGRFISQDTYRGELNDPGQWRLYAYCANNPINYVDPSGHVSYKWGTKAVLKGPKTDYWYCTGYMKGKGNAKYTMLRVGASARYQIKYYKLMKHQKTNCENYKKAIKACNKSYNEIKTLLVSAGVNLSAYVFLDSTKNNELGAAYQKDGNEDLLKTSLENSSWKKSYDTVKRLYKIIKRYGKSY